MVRSKGALVVLLVAVMALGLTAWAAAEEAPPYHIIADVVRGGKNATGPVCVLNSVFKLGEQVVWRAEIFDGKTGKLLEKADIDRLGLKAVAEVDGVGTFPLTYGPHPKEAPQVYFWAGAWEIPAIFKTGSFSWRIVVTDKNGNKSVYEPVGGRRPEMPGSWIVIEKR
ncbi:MAG: hypothetical protein AB1700_20685 [Bacillota bacterium]